MNAMSLLLLALPISAMAFSSGPPNGLTGAPGENTCFQCHGGNEFNSDGGSMWISGPASYESGQVYPITVSLQHAGQSRWGFELTTPDGLLFQVTDPVNTQLSGTYMKQTSTGTMAGTTDGPVSWTFDWQAPESDSQVVTFYAAGNAANGNGSASGDYIYTTELSVAPGFSEVPDLDIAYNDGSVELAWTALSGASSYRVERKTALDDAWTTIGSSANPGFTLVDLEEMGLFRVIALND